MEGRRKGESESEQDKVLEAKSTSEETMADSKSEENTLKVHQLQTGKKQRDPHHNQTVKKNGDKESGKQQERLKWPHTCDSLIWIMINIPSETRGQKVDG